MAGRPKANIDWDKVGKMLEADCTAEGIAATIGVCRDILYKRCKLDNKVDFSTFSQQKKSKGDDLLRMKQFQTAMSGNVSMQIWLGKQRLDQTDKKEVNVTDTGKEYRNAVQQLIDAKAAKDAPEAIQLLKDVNFPPPPGMESEIVREVKVGLK